MHKKLGAKNTGSRMVQAMVALLVSGSFFAQSSAQQASDKEPAEKKEQLKVLMPSLKIGVATQRLFDMQAGGTLASDRSYPVPAAVAEKIYQRYLDSFSHPIPEKSGSALEKLE